MEQNNQRLENLKNALISIGFSAEEAEKQISELDQIITMTLLAKVAKEKNAKDLTPENFQTFLSENYQPEELKKFLDEESGKIISNYLQEITSDLPEDKKQAFYSQIR